MYLDSWQTLIHIYTPDTALRPLLLNYKTEQLMYIKPICELLHHKQPQQLPSPLLT